MMFSAWQLTCGSGALSENNPWKWARGGRELVGGHASTKGRECAHARTCTRSRTRTHTHRRARTHMRSRTHALHRAPLTARCSRLVCRKLAVSTRHHWPALTSALTCRRRGVVRRSASEEVVAGVGGAPHQAPKPQSLKASNRLFDPARTLAPHRVSMSLDTHCSAKHVQLSTSSMSVTRRRSSCRNLPAPLLRRRGQGAEPGVGRGGLGRQAWGWRGAGRAPRCMGGALGGSGWRAGCWAWWGPVAGTAPTACPCMHGTCPWEGASKWPGAWPTRMQPAPAPPFTACAACLPRPTLTAPAGPLRCLLPARQRPP